MFVERYEEVEKVIPLYEEILSFNPNDNQGIRAYLSTAYLKTNQPEKAIRLASHYPDDITPDVIMGKLLALMQTKKMSEAKKYLNKIKEYQLHVIRELFKSSHPKPAILMKDRVTVGGNDEAYYYWQSQGHLWQKTDGALAFLEKLSPVEKFSQLFQHYRQQLNWAYYVSFTEKQEALAKLLQVQQDYIWQLLKEKGMELVDYQTFCKALRDNLRLQPLLEELYSNPEEILYRRINTILFSRILTLFGCVEPETKQIDKWETIIMKSARMQKQPKYILLLPEY